MAEKKLICRHCRKRLANARKRFCRICYDIPGLKDYYDQLDELALLKDLPPPASPTACLPGSPTKLEIMQMRTMRGMSIFHESDLKPELS